MIQTCCICEKIIQEGDNVSVMVTSTYHLLKSTCTFALDKEALIADPRTLCHELCDKGINDNG
jgi:hypothetical protein